MKIKIKIKNMENVLHVSKNMVKMEKIWSSINVRAQRTQFNVTLIYVLIVTKIKIKTVVGYLFMNLWTGQK